MLIYSDQSYDTDQDFGPNEDMENMLVDDGQANQNAITGSIQVG